MLITGSVSYYMSHATEGSFESIKIFKRVRYPYNMWY